MVTARNPTEVSPSEFRDAFEAEAHKRGHDDFSRAKSGAYRSESIESIWQIAQAAAQAACDVQTVKVHAENVHEVLLHVCMELSGVISEYRAMPCDSLRQRMFVTADRYAKRISECHVIIVTRRILDKEPCKHETYKSVSINNSANSPQVAECVKCGFRPNQFWG